MSDDTAAARFHLLPHEVLRNILLKLPSRSIARLRCVSKSWLSITTRRSFLLDHTRRSRNSILIHTISRQSEYSILRHIDLLLLPPGGATLLPDRRRSSSDVAIASCDGLLCLLDKLRERFQGKQDISCYYILNPLTGAQLDVPEPTCAEGHLMGMYFQPSTGEYRMIRRSNSNSNSVDVISLPGEAWRTLDSSPPRGSVSSRTPVELNGILYWIAYKTIETRASGILGFDIMKEEFKLMPFPLGDMRIFGNSSLFIMGNRLVFAVFDRELSSVGELGIDVWAVKDFDNVEWEKLCSVRCSSGLDRIDFRYGYWIDDTALCIRKEEMVVFFGGPHSYLLQFDLKARRYSTMEVLDPEQNLCHFSLLYKESLISYDSFIR